MSIQINPNRIDYFKKCCNIFWQFEEEDIQDGCQLKIRDNSDIITINVYNNGRILCQGSPKKPSLKKVRDIVERIANTIELPFSESDHQLIDRATVLKNHIESLDMNQDIHRMSIVIISDTSCEILLKARAELIANKNNIPIKKLNLDNRGTIYKFIEDKNCIEIMEKRIKNLRERRNKLVHDGDIPTIKDAEFAIEVLSEYLEM